MKGKIIKNTLVFLVIFISAVSYSGCKKQAKCGCGKDILFSLDTNTIFQYSDITFTSGGATAYFQIYNGIYYDTYYFCNPSEWYAVYDSMAGVGQVKLRGDVYCDCSYINSQSNNSSYTYYKIYNIQVTLLAPHLYGKK